MDQRVRRMVRGIPLTSVLMFVFALGLVTVSKTDALARLIRTDVARVFWIVGLGLLGIALAAAFGVRIAQLEWQSTIVSALLFFIVFLLGLQFDAPNLLIGEMSILMFALPGVFLLPLLDPLVRRTGPAPSRKKLLLSAPALTTILVLLDTVFARAGNFGSFTFWVGAAIALVLGVTGMFLALANLTRESAWLGGLRLTIFPLTLISGLLLSVAFPLLAD